MINNVQYYLGQNEIPIAASRYEADVSFDISEDMLRFWTIKNCFESEKGKFQLFIGFDSVSENSAEFELI